MSTDFVTIVGRIKGPILPHLMFGHCLTKLSSDRAAITGGGDQTDQNYLYREVYTVDLRDFIFSWAASLPAGRFEHVCGFLSDSDDSSKKHLVVAGGQVFDQSGSYLEYTKTTLMLERIGEFLTKDWIDGPELPKNLRSAAGVITPDGTRFIVVGGSDSNSWELTVTGAIFELQCWSRSIGCQWTKWDKELATPRSAHIALIVPEKSNLDCYFI